MQIRRYGLILLALPLLAIAKSGATNKLSTKEVDAVLAGYRKAKSIQAKVKKTVTQETMGTEMKSTGNFYFNKGKLRLDISEPERTTLVYDGKFVWFESRLDGENVSVTKMRANELRKSDSILASLFDKKDALKNFTTTDIKHVDGKATFFFSAKNKKKSDIQSLELEVKGDDLTRISYKDQIENLVTLEFSNVSRGNVPAEKFAYRPPPNAEVSEP